MENKQKAKEHWETKGLKMIESSKIGLPIYAYEIKTRTGSIYIIDETDDSENNIARILSTNDKNVSSEKDPAAVSLGKRGGKAGTGAAKRRPIDYSALAKKRWDK